MAPILKRLHCTYSFTKRVIELHSKKPDFETTYFEGGFGSQLLSYIEYANKCRAFLEPSFVDVSYFAPVENFNFPPGFIKRNWRLDHYGLHLTKMRELERREGKSKKRRPSDEERTKFGLANELFKIDSEILARLAIRSEQSHRDKLFFSGRRTSNYGVVHIRKGDYLQVSSKVITVGDITKILGRIKSILPRVVVFVTDGIFSKMEKLQIRDAVGEVKYQYFRFYDQTNTRCDEILIHDLMRCAKFLITSNSTFSFTAALLNVVQGSIVLMPNDFYRGPSADLNPIFKSTGEFTLLH